MAPPAVMYKDLASVLRLGSEELAWVGSTWAQRVSHRSRVPCRSKRRRWARLEARVRASMIMVHGSLRATMAARKREQLFINEIVDVEHVRRQLMS